MSAIYVMAGDERVGPLTTEEIREAVEEGRLSLENLAWQEGMEDWLPLSEVLEIPEDCDSEEEDFESMILLEGPGYILSPGCLQVGTELFPIANLVKAEVEIEHTKRGKAVGASIVFGVLLAVALAMPLRPETSQHWILWGISVVVIVGLLIRSLLAAFKPTPAFVAVHLLGGDDRILPMSPSEARAAANAVNNAIAASRESAEA